MHHLTVESAKVLHRVGFDQLLLSTTVSECDSQDHRTENSGSKKTNPRQVWEMCPSAHQPPRNGENLNQSGSTNYLFLARYVLLVQPLVMQIMPGLDVTCHRFNAKFAADRLWAAYHGQMVSRVNEICE